jgi:hypothetical protein
MESNDARIWAAIRWRRNRFLTRLASTSTTNHNRKPRYLKNATSFEYDDDDDGDKKAVDGVGSDIDKKDDRLAGGHWATDGASSDVNNKVDPLAGGP